VGAVAAAGGRGLLWPGAWLPGVCAVHCLKDRGVRQKCERLLHVCLHCSCGGEQRNQMIHEVRCGLLFVPTNVCGRSSLLTPCSGLVHGTSPGLQLPASVQLLRLH
jgi:hypothetical protein